jgi:hypothetical protein
MNSYQRFLTAMRGELPDRVPVACWLGLPYLLKTTPGARTYTDLFDLWVDDPRNTIVARQEELGLDPMVLTNSLHWGEVLDFPARTFSWPEAALAGWHEQREVLADKGRHKVVRRVIRTPEGDLDFT